MAWRIDEYVIHGEIDNRTRGRVTGRIWFAGRPEPVELALSGNAWRDLAGRKLEFVNPAPKSGLDARFATLQSGPAGDLTASRKVRVPEIPMDQISAYYAAGKEFPWHWSNSVYMEWFSQRNGRVVIESSCFQLTISPESSWEMTAAEEETQREANAAASAGSIKSRGSAIDVGRFRTGNASQPMTEAEAEKLQSEADRMMDRIMERMEREGVEADFERIVREENDRARRERGEPPPTPEEEAERSRWIDEMNAAAAEELEDDPREPWKNEGEPPGNPFEAGHPLAAQAFELSVRVVRDPIERGWLPSDARPEHPVLDLAMSVSHAGATLSSALNDDWPPPLEDCAMILVRLKKAAGCLEDAALAAQCCADEKLTNAAWLEGLNREITSISDAIAGMIAELRDRLAPDASF